MGTMTFADLDLARRLEGAEGYACAQFAEARVRLFPDSGSEWIEIDGATAIFDGIETPTTQSFGLGIFEPLKASTLEAMERFFFEKGAEALHEVCPLADAPALSLLCSRGYRPIEISNVLYRAVEKPNTVHAANIRVREVSLEEAPLWGSISARGWTHEHPELEAFVQQMGVLCVARKQSPCFLAEVDGQPGAAGTLSIHKGVALFGGAATIPELRRRGLQSALLQERMDYAFEQGCDLAMMVAQAGSNSQRNAERKGFRIAYTRIKWRLAP
jgi:GNAT superfamily N-acetyltransferase